MRQEPIYNNPMYNSINTQFSKSNVPNDFKWIKWIKMNQMIKCIKCQMNQSDHEINQKNVVENTIDGDLDQAKILRDYFDYKSKLLSTKKQEEQEKQEKQEKQEEEKQEGEKVQQSVPIPDIIINPEYEAEYAELFKPSVKPNAQYAKIQKTESICS